MLALIANLIGKIRARAHDLWEGEAAEPNVIRALEVDIGSALPPTYIHHCVHMARSCFTMPLSPV